MVPGPGLLNTTAALATAYATNSPVLCISGQIPSNLIGRGFGLLHEIPDQLAVLRGHCDAAGRDYDAIEKTHVQSWLLARASAAVTAKRERLPARGWVPGFVGTLTEAIDLIGQYEAAGIDVMINADRFSDAETRELFASDVMPRFA